MRAYAYPRLTGSVTARVTEVRLRGPGDSREHLESRGWSVVEQVVALGTAEREDWHAARISLAVTVPTREIETKRHWSDVAVVAVLTEGITNARTVARLTPGTDDGQEWTGEIELDRHSHVDRASLVMHVVATVGGVAGRVIGATEQEWLVDVISDAPLRDRQLDVTTVSFARGKEWLRPFRDVPWAVDISGQMPAVRLNSDFEGFSALLQNPGSKMETMVGEMLLGQMCADVWTAVFHTAIGDLEIEEDGTPLFPPDWRGAVLREMLPDIVPGRSAQSALREVHNRRVGEGSWTDLQPRIQYAAARRAEVPKAVMAAVRGIERLEQETHA